MTEAKPKIEKEQIKPYLEENLGKPLYIVEENKILMSLVGVDHKTFKLVDYSQMDKNDNVPEHVIPYKNLSNKKFYAENYEVFTSPGMALTLNLWEQLESTRNW